MSDRELDPRPLFVIGVIAVIAVGGWFILGMGESQEHPEFAQCLAENDVTMYGFKLCPNCNKQVDIIGQEAFKTHIEDTGRYVLCRPEEEARSPIGDRLDNITILPEYADEVTAETTQGDLCADMVGRGTPTWIIEHEGEVQQISGWRTIPELADASGCPVPENFEGQETADGDRVTEQ